VEKKNYYFDDMLKWKYGRKERETEKQSYVVMCKRDILRKKIIKIEKSITRIKVIHT